MKTITATLSINVVIECPDNTTDASVRDSLNRLADQAAGGGLFTLFDPVAQVVEWGSDVSID
jgi:hypothetical protein